MSMYQAPASQGVAQSAASRPAALDIGRYQAPASLGMVQRAAPLLADQGMMQGGALAWKDAYYGYRANLPQDGNATSYRDSFSRYPFATAPSGSFQQWHPSKFLTSDRLTATQMPSVSEWPRQVSSSTAMPMGQASHWHGTDWQRSCADVGGSWVSAFPRDGQSVAVPHSQAIAASKNLMGDGAPTPPKPPVIN